MPSGATIGATALAASFMSRVTGLSASAFFRCVLRIVGLKLTLSSQTLVKLRPGFDESAR
jgi:hypothetical protein